jgi:hypothetical protein
VPELDGNMECNLLKLDPLLLLDDDYGAVGARPHAHAALLETLQTQERSGDQAIRSD